MSVEEYYNLIYVIVLTLVGLCVGSFLNVVIYRVPNHMSLAMPPSHCPNCDYQLKWYDNIPILSYVLLKGKCRNCGCHISFRYTIVEVVNMIFWFAVALMTMASEKHIDAAITLTVCSVCICIFFIDLEHMIIPDRFQVILLIAGLVHLYFDLDNWLTYVIGCGAGLLAFLLVGFAVGKIMGREALGGGDIKLAAVSGLLLGWQKLLLMMLVASLIGSIYMLIKKREEGESREIPFGPFLVIGLLLAVFAGDAIIDLYLSLFLL